MYHLIKILIITLFATTVHASQEEVKTTSWKLKEDLIAVPSLDQKTNTHQFKLGLGSKYVADLFIETKKGNFNLTEQNIPGLNINYDYQFKFEKIWFSTYSNIGYFTTYNNLGAQGYADLSVVDLYLGAGLSLPLFNQHLIPKAFLGLGHSYYFQRGDVKEVSADKNYNEFEYGFGVEYSFSNNSAFPSAWNSKYLVGFKYHKFQSINSPEKIEGDKIMASVGVEL